MNRKDILSLLSKRVKRLRKTFRRVAENPSNPEGAHTLCILLENAWDDAKRDSKENPEVLETFHKRVYLIEEKVSQWGNEGSGALFDV